MSTERAAGTRTAHPDFFRAASRLAFPSVCLACGEREVERVREGGVCRRCWDALPAPPPKACVRCDEPLPALETDVCGRCLLDLPPFSTLRGAVAYRGAARAILIAFKFRGAGFLARHMARIMVERIPSEGEVDEVVPVPSTRLSRLRRDHAAESLAAELSRRIGAPFVPARLRKVRSTARQSGLPADRRRANVRNAFRAAGRPPARVLLVDDVATSASTARECAAALLGAGSRRVDVWCFARATRDDRVAGGAPPGEGEP